MARKTKHNDLTNEELLSHVNPGNMRLKTDFLNYLHSIQRSDGTIAGYDNDLNIFFVYVSQNLGNKDFAKITKRDIISYQNWLINTNKNSPARVRRLKAAISSLSNYVENILDDEEEFKNFRSIVNRIESPINNPVRRKTVLSEEQVQALLDDLVDRNRIKQACAVALAAFSGRRKAELPRFRVVDFDDSNLICGGALYRTQEPIQTKGRGNGKYIYCYTLAKKFKPYFDLWMDCRKRNGIESEWLLPDKNDPTKQISKSTLDTWTSQFTNFLGEDFYWHCLRHAFTTNLIRAGLPERIIQGIVGWDSTDMVNLYTDIELDEELETWFKDGEINTDNKKDVSDL